MTNNSDIITEIGIETSKETIVARLVAAFIAAWVCFSVNMVTISLGIAHILLLEVLCHPYMFTVIGGVVRLGGCNFTS